MAINIYSNPFKTVAPQPTLRRSVTGGELGPGEVYIGTGDTTNQYAINNPPNTTVYTPDYDPLTDPNNPINQPKATTTQNTPTGTTALDFGGNNGDVYWYQGKAYKKVNNQWQEYTPQINETGTYDGNPYYWNGTQWISGAVPSPQADQTTTQDFGGEVGDVFWNGADGKTYRKGPGGWYETTEYEGGRGTYNGQEYVFNGTQWILASDYTAPAGPVVDPNENPEEGQAGVGEHSGETYINGQWLDNGAEGYHQTFDGVEYYWDVDQNKWVSAPDEGKRRNIKGYEEVFENYRWVRADSHTAGDSRNNPTTGQPETWDGFQWVLDNNNTTGSGAITFRYEQEVGPNGQTRTVKVYRSVGGVEDPNPIADYTNIYSQMDQAATMIPKDFNTWASDYGYNYRPVEETEEYKAYQALTDLMQSVDLPGQDTVEADTIAAQSLGMTYDEYVAYKKGYQDWVGNTDIGATYKGMGDEARLNYERMINNNTRRSEEEARRSLDQILSGATGNSTQRALMLSNQYTQTIQDEQLKASIELENLDYARKVEQFKMEEAAYVRQLEMGQITATQVFNQIQSNRDSALESYADQVDAIISQNEGYLRMYEGDLRAVGMAVDQIYKAVELELNVINPAMTKQIEDMINGYWEDLAANKDWAEADSNALFSNIMSILKLITGIFSAVRPGGL